MKKLIVISCTLLFFFGCVTLDSKYFIKTVPSPTRFFSKVAVIPENWDSYWISSFSHRALVTELMDAGFQVIERSNIETTIKEQQSETAGKIKMDDTGSMSFELYTLDKTTISELGEKLGVNHLILVYVVPTGRKVHMGTVRLVEVETAKILTSTTFIAPRKGEDTDIVMKQVAFEPLISSSTFSSPMRSAQNIGPPR